MAGLGAFYKAGLDYVGRQIVVFVGRHLPVTKIDMDKVELPPVVYRGYPLSRGYLHYNYK